MTSSCDACLRRAFLLGRLAAPIDRLGSDGRPRPQVLLALADEDLAAGVAGPAAGSALLDEIAGLDLARIRAGLHDRGLGCCCPHGSGYPPQLGDLPDRPGCLFHTGPPERFVTLTAAESVALVGSRSASDYGLEVARTLGRGVGAAGVPVVSGLALGIDAAAHEGCLAGSGAAVAVLAGGVDVPYPRRHRRLYERIVDGGIVVSEQPPGQAPFRWGFPARNRIMAGLARCTVVVEAGDPSGSLLTARDAAGAGRDVGAVPGRVTSRTAVGTNNLLRDGAHTITSPQDVLDLMFGAGAITAALPGLTAPCPADRALLDGVADGLDVGTLASRAGLAVGEARAALSRLETAGHVRRGALGAYELAWGGS